MAHNRWMHRADVMRWVAAYEQAWRDDDVSAVARMFTEDARYWRSPFEEPLIGHGPLEGFWLEDQGRRFTFDAEPVAVEGADAVVRVQVCYLEPQVQEYRDLWVLRFAGDGRVEHFEEWPFWPGTSYIADGDVSD